MALKKIKINEGDTVLLLGAGGVARAILVALLNCGVKNVTITSRNRERAKKLANIFGYNTCDWETRKFFIGTTLINATPCGMANKTPQIAIDPDCIPKFKKIMDVVVNYNKTQLIKYAEDFNLQYVSGLYMTFYQAAEQYKIYTEKHAPVGRMVEAFNKRFSTDFRI